MAPFRDHDFFGGVYEERVPSGGKKRFSLIAPSAYEDETGTHICPRINPFAPFNEIDSLCFDAVEMGCELVVDLLPADNTIVGQTVGERALLSPAPAFVQVGVNMSVHTSPGVPPGVCPEELVRLPGCVPNLEPEGDWLIEADWGYWPFGVVDDPGEGSGVGGPPYTYPPQEIDFDNTGDASVGDLAFLRRAPDGSSHVSGENLGIDTLIPWADFIANPTITLGAFGAQLKVHSFAFSYSIHARLWYLIGGTPGEWMCVL